MSLVRRLSVFVAAVVLLAVGATNFVSSQSTEPGSGLSISPTRTPLSISPGNKDILKLSIRNVTTNTITAKPVVNDFESDNETGQPKLIINEERNDLPSIRPFLSNLKDVVLKEGETKTVEILVSIPEGTAAGGYYGIVRYLAVPEGTVAPDPGKVSLTASVSSILLLEVPGEIREQVQLKDILVYRRNVPGSFFTSKPEEIGIKIVNQGNGFTQPFGDVTIKNPFGRTVQTYPLNSGAPPSNVLPASTRIFRDALSGVSVPGRYSATANVSFGNGGEVLSLTQSFWYLPWWFVLILLVLLVVIGLLVQKVKKRLESKNYKKTAPRKNKNR